MPRTQIYGQALWQRKFQIESGASCSGMLSFPNVVTLFSMNYHPIIALCLNRFSQRHLTSR